MKAYSFLRIEDKIKTLKDAESRITLELKENIKKLFGTGNVLSSQYIKVKDVKDNFDELISYEYSARELWRYINLELWLQIFFDRRS